MPGDRGNKLVDADVSHWSFDSGDDPPDDLPDLDPAAVALAIAHLRAEGDDEAAAELLHLLGDSDADDGDGTPVAEDRSGLTKKQITNKAGEKQTVYVRPDQGDAGGDEPGTAAGDAHLQKLLAEIPEEHRDKAVGVLGRVAKRVNQFLVDHATAVFAAGKAVAFLDAVLTTPEDVAKYPWLAGKFGANSQGTGDQLGDAVGVPGHLAARVVAASLVKGWAAAKRLAGGKKAEAADDGVRAAAEFLAGLLNAALEELGLPADADAGEIAGHLGA